MKNERRDTARVPIELEVMLNPDTQGYQLFRTRDVSLEGVFVEPASRLAKNSTVNLAIKLTSDGRTRVHRVSARVVRVTPHGAGLAFDDIDSEVYAALLELVFAQLPKGSF